MTRGGTIHHYTSFEKNSVFAAVENIFQGNDFIVCDDLGDEWADHIVISNETKKIIFIHSKYGKQATSASKMHDVVSQANKNVGNMFFDDSKFISKIKKLESKCYANDKVSTAINRVRQGKIIDVESYLSALLVDPKLTRECVLCCSFISKKKVESELKKVKKGKSKGYVVHLVWILTSFVHSMREAGVVPKIYCVD